jgi:hypothetical protein
VSCLKCASDGGAGVARQAAWLAWRILGEYRRGRRWRHRSGSAGRTGGGRGRTVGWEEQPAVGWGGGGLGGRRDRRRPEEMEKEVGVCGRGMGTVGVV